MNTLRKPDLPDDLRNEMARLKGAGLNLVPLGGGADGKAPCVRNWATRQMTLRQILGPMHGSGSRVYGVRLDGLAVIDCDSADRELVADIEARFGPSPVHVKTPRGIHLYYHAGSDKMPNLRSEGLPVDIKAGARSFVVGPLSVRPDGEEYFPVRGVLGEDLLPRLLAPSDAPIQSRALPTGQRHYGLLKEAIKMVGQVDNLNELTGNLIFWRDGICENPATLLDSEVQKIAAWAWQRRLIGKVFTKRDSEFSVHRLALDRLKGTPNASDAIALYVVITDQHGHTPGKRFPLDWRGMRDAGHTELSKERFRAARQTLETNGLLWIAGKHCAGSRPRTYSLARIRPGISDAGNVASFAAQGFGESRGEG